MPGKAIKNSNKNASRVHTKCTHTYTKAIPTYTYSKSTGLAEIKINKTLNSTRPGASTPEGVCVCECMCVCKCAVYTHYNFTRKLSGYFAKLPKDQECMQEPACVYYKIVSHSRGNWCNKLGGWGWSFFTKLKYKSICLLEQ